MSNTDLDIIFDRLKQLEQRVSDLEYLQAIEEGVKAADVGKFKPLGDVKEEWIKKMNKTWEEIVYPDYMMTSSRKTPCMWELMPEADKFKPMGLSCPCPKCTPRC